ncbi:MAG TPA: hypothetical protein VN864_02205, partial [Thermoplasmata archaeon]|nr:hypothetical protein [Thermoplasmata archaeon]
MTEPNPPNANGIAPVPVAIVLPTLNEEEGLARTLEDIPLEHLVAAGFAPTFLVVDGHSTDQTL